MMILLLCLIEILGYFGDDALLLQTCLILSV